ncbi:MAG: hypothetical protein GWN87_28115, partial [Desulfuromonadales bacterium]|nr:hypothetical protein [Desulfuromonadales bacterium]
EPDRDRRVRRLMEIQLLEYSVVTFAANPEAFVTDVKDRACLIGQFLETEIGLETKTARDAVELLTPLLNPEPPEHSEDPGAGRQKPGDNNHVDVDGLKDSLVDLLS